MKQYYVYIMASAWRTLYIGMTSNLEARVYQHKHKVFGGFTAEHNVNQLVYFEMYDHPSDAIGRERQLKRWVRAKKIGLVERMNPEWRDLSLEWNEVEGLV